MQIFSPESAPKRVDDPTVAWEMAKEEKRYQEQIREEKQYGGHDENLSRIEAEKNQAIEKRREVYERAKKLAESLMENALRHGTSEYVPKWPVDWELSSLTEKVLLELLTDNEPDADGRIRNLLQDNRWKIAGLTYHRIGTSGFRVLYRGELPESHTEPAQPANPTKSIENMGSYERQKIENALSQAEMMVRIIRNYLAAVDLCDELGIHIPDRAKFDKLLYLHAPAGPDNDMEKIRKDFEASLSEVLRNLPRQHQTKLQQSML